MSLKKHARLLAIALDVVILAYFWVHYVPVLRHPFDVLLVLLAILCAGTALVVKKSAPRGFLIALAAVSLTLFTLEMCQKYFNIVNAFSTVNIRAADNTGDPYPWEHKNPASYLMALRQARRDGVDPEVLEKEHFPREVFSATEKESVLSYRDRLNGGMAVKEFIGSDQTVGPPLGFELVAGQMLREYITADPENTIVHDGAGQINSAGVRTTFGSNDSADDCYLFLGCSFTYGLLVDNDRTLPYYFLQQSDFTVRVVNLGVCGYGPNQVYLDFSLAKRLEKSEIDPTKVKGVFYGLIDDHANRVVMPAKADAPYYEMENGKPVFKGSYRKYMEGRGRLARMMDHSRIYPVFKERLVDRISPGDLSNKWRVTAALLEEIDLLCRERYGVPLTVVYWDEDTSVMRLLESHRLRTIPVSDAFGEDWRQDSRIKYFLYDYHPSANAYKLLGRYLADTVIP
jgi:hypothetical protein